MTFVSVGFKEWEVGTLPKETMAKSFRAKIVVDYFRHSVATEETHTTSSCILKISHKPWAKRSQFFGQTAGTTRESVFIYFVDYNFYLSIFLIVIILIKDNLYLLFFLKKRR